MFGGGGGGGFQNETLTWIPFSLEECVVCVNDWKRVEQGGYS